MVEYLNKRGKGLAAKALTPMTNGYSPEIDISPELGHEYSAYYNSLIGVLRWIVEMCRVDINIKALMLFSHIAMPREVNLEELLHIFAYIKKHMNYKMVFDSSIPDIDMNYLQCQDWSYSIYSSTGDTLEKYLQPNISTSLGSGFKIHCFVDADHAGESLTRRSRTGFIVLLNNSSIYWHTKKQASAETSTFVSEFMSMKHATEYLRGLCYKLQMFGIPIDEPEFSHGDNQSVFLNKTMPQSTLNN